MDNMEDYYMAEENRGGARLFHLFHLVWKFFWLFCLARCLACVCVLGLLVCGGFLLLVFVFKGNLSQSQLIPVVDRPCLALVRQCREKKKAPERILENIRLSAVSSALNRQFIRHTSCIIERTKPQSCVKRQNCSVSRGQRMKLLTH